MVPEEGSVYWKISFFFWGGGSVVPGPEGKKCDQKHRACCQNKDKKTKKRKWQNDRATVLFLKNMPFEGKKYGQLPYMFFPVYLF
jgi:hypothetical protein